MQGVFEITYMANHSLCGGNGEKPGLDPIFVQALTGEFKICQFEIDSILRIFAYNRRMNKFQNR